MKVSDCIVDILVKKAKVKHVFGITGGYIVHIFDSIAKNPHIDYVCTNHEQGASMAADGYTRISNNIGVAISTSGPGAANLINGILCAHFDSVPLNIRKGPYESSNNGLHSFHQIRQDSFLRHQERCSLENPRALVVFESLYFLPYVRFFEAAFLRPFQ